MFQMLNGVTAQMTKHTSGSLHAPDLDVDGNNVQGDEDVNAH